MKQFDRSEEDIGNSVLLEHVNLRVPDQQLATLFYVSGLGLTRDPYLMSGLENMWMNVGRNQFHLPRGQPQVLRGRTGLVIEDRGALLQRLAAVRQGLAETRFDYAEHADHVDVTCPWGNRFRCHVPDLGRFGAVLLGIAYVELDVAPGTSKGIVQFYRQALRVKADACDDETGLSARVQIGRWQHLVFRETDRPVAAYDGHHLQIYLNDFSGPHRWLLERGLISEESSQHQYRFKDIIDPDDGRPLHVVEHEVRSMTHPLFGRPLINRNPAQNNRAYSPGYDAAQVLMGRDRH